MKKASIPKETVAFNVHSAGFEPSRLAGMIKSQILKQSVRDYPLKIHLRIDISTMETYAMKYQSQIQIWNTQRS